MKNLRSFKPNINQIPVDIRNAGKSYQIIADIPGITKQDAKVDIDDNRMLTITAERNSYKKFDDKENDSFIRIERSQGLVKRSIRLPDDADEDKVSASFENGVLTIDIQKSGVFTYKKMKNIPVK